jgi:putative ATP-dependent endonuclease of the OLD family
MRIERVCFSNYRSLTRAELPNCADLNVLIGKNNSGKSNALSGIELVFTHFATGRIAGDWTPVGRPVDEFTARNVASPIDVGLELAIPPELHTRLRELIKAETEGVDVAVDRLAAHPSLAVVVSAIIADEHLIRYVSDVGLGKLRYVEGRVNVTGQRLFAAERAVAVELADRERGLARKRQELQLLARLSADSALRDLWRTRAREGAPTEFYLRRRIESLSAPQVHAVEIAVREAETMEELSQRLEQIRSSLSSSLSDEEGRMTSSQMQAFAGTVRRPPNYILWLLEELGKTDLLHFRESRTPIGPREASELLRLKTTRGGPEQLSDFQRTVRSLLGVTVDAFEASGEELRSQTWREEGVARPAEMDIDDFLVEANGAGIREALRLMLDLELKSPAIILIEEPEVHLHPGLEKIMHSYLIAKAKEIQIFTATHSTSFVDVSSEQSVYIVSRKGGRTEIERAVSEDDVLRIPGEIGLRPSTVFMFDRLLFVEGPSDEAILRAFSRTLTVDLTSRNVGFVAMGGASNFAHFAAEATLDLLSRRQIPVWFVVDRDEREDVELARMIERVGDRAKLVPLSAREMENYLLVPDALCTLLTDKLRTSEERVKRELTREKVDEQIGEVADGLLDRAV